MAVSAAARRGGAARRAARRETDVSTPDGAIRHAPRAPRPHRHQAGTVRRDADRAGLPVIKLATEMQAMKAKR
jgi:hypothetical protein